MRGWVLVIRPPLVNPKSPYFDENLSIASHPKVTQLTTGDRPLFNPSGNRRIFSAALTWSLQRPRSAQKENPSGVRTGSTTSHCDLELRTSRASRVRPVVLARQRIRAVGLHLIR